MKRRAFLTLPIIGAIVGAVKRCFRIGEWTGTVDGSGRIYTDAENAAIETANAQRQ